LNVEPSSNPFEDKKPETASPAAKQTVAPSTVPNVVGLDVAEAQKMIQGSGLRMRAEGRGTAISQDVAPNTVVEKGTEIVVRFAP
ncbi:MAG: PASTA domain-containing protein, partial [Schwartzia sp.]|nr:PASTA domain-containing protein [Schwartzia sp. (in: firmicutes)]